MSKAKPCKKLITYQSPKDFLGKSEEVIGKKKAPRTYRPWGFGTDTQNGTGLKT